MTDFIVSLQDAGQLSPSDVGGKAHALGRLLSKGFRVPEGYVITTAAFAEFDGADSVPDDLFAPLNGQQWAFRSSACGEDGAEASFAGQYVSVLSVEGKERAKDALRTCWDAARSVQLSQYTESVGHNGGALAVLVQRMVAADFAGVAFTRNPVTGADEVVIEATQGLGDALLEGEVDPERWVAPRGEAPRRDQGPEVLPPSIAAEVEKLCREVERQQGAPQDIEWAVEGGDVYLLQARPITVLPIEPTDRPPPHQIWDRVDSHFPKPVLPLASSMWLPMHGRCFTRVCAEVGFPFETIRSRVYGGRVYSRIEPVGDGGKGRDDRGAPPRFVFWLLLRMVPEMRRRMASARRAARDDLPMQLISKWEEHERARLDARTIELRDTERAALDDEQLADHIDDICAHTEDAGYQHFALAAVSGMSTLGALGKLVQSELGWTTTEIFDLVQGYSTPSTELGDALDAVAEACRQDEEGVALLRSNPTALRDHEGPAGVALQDFLDRYGHRTFDASLDEPLWSEDPRPLCRLVQSRLGADAARTDPLARSRAAEERLREEVPAADWARYERLLERARRARPYQDETEAKCFEAFGVLRYAALEAAPRLVRRGVLKDESHVWFLEIHELTAALCGAQINVDIDQRRAEFRWAQSNELAARLGPEPGAFPDIPFPAEVEEMLGGAFWAVAAMDRGDSNPPPDADLTGFACSPGKITAPVRVIASVSELHTLEPGEILVCRGTSASWSFAFPLVAGLITEIGGPLSHPGTLAREYGIPAVLGVKGATIALQTGDVVTIDGGAGAIWLN